MKLYPWQKDLLKVLSKGPVRLAYTRKMGHDAELWRALWRRSAEDLDDQPRRLPSSDDSPG